MADNDAPPWPDEDFGRMPPSDSNREQLVLSAMMNDPADVIDDVLQTGLTPEDFYRPAHQVIAGAVIAMFAASETIDPVSLADWIARDGDSRALGGPGHDRMFLFGLWQISPNRLGAAYHADLVHKLAIKRREVELGQRLIQRGYELDPDTAGADLAAAEAEIAELGGQLGDADHALGPDDFLAAAARRAGRQPGAKRTPRWVIPGMLARRDRAIIIGPEGAGKSMVGLQLAVAGACGIHPFLPDLIPPVRAVYIDLETPEDQLAGRVEQMLDVARRAGGDPGKRLVIWSRDQEWLRLSGVRDQHRLSQVLRRHLSAGDEPRLVVAGPLYKMLDEKPEHGEHIAVAEFWNRMLGRWDNALWLEAHAPMAMRGVRDWRPFGSGLWTRWPEVGRWMRAVKDADRTWELPGFRDHDRDDLAAPRTWPDRIWWRNSYGWPWGGSYDPAVLGAPSWAPPDVVSAAEAAAEERNNDLGERRARQETSQ